MNMYFDVIFVMYLRFEVHYKWPFNTIKHTSFFAQGCSPNQKKN